MRPTLEPLRIVGTTTIAAVLYGVVHDQITARICLEYFTVTHPGLITFAEPPEPPEPPGPMVIGLMWGVVATWWVGLIAGTLLVVACRVGRWPRLSNRWVLPRLGLVLLVTGGLAGLAGAVMAMNPDANILEGVYTPDTVARIPEENRDGWDICLAVQTVSYLVGSVGGVALVVLAVFDRWRSSRAPAA